MPTNADHKTQSGSTHSGAQVIVKALARAGVEVIFGFPGGMVIPLYDAIYDAPFKHILTRHEQGAVHAADGYARATGKVGVVVATSGPGATNLVTGVANALMDSVPLVALTGQVPTQSIGNDSFQEVDIYGISIPITKYNYLLRDPAELSKTIAEAFFLATTGRPGPILVDIPKDLQTAVLTSDEPGPVIIPGYNPMPKGHPRQIETFIDALATCHRPLAYIGGGITAAGAEEELFRFLTTAQVPVVSTLMGKGSFPEDHPLSLGLPGMHGLKSANMAIYEADLIIGLGVRFDDRVAGNVRRFSPAARIVHVDVDPAEIGKRLRTGVPIVGNVKAVLAEVNKNLRAQPKAQWLAHLKELKKKYPLRYQDSDTVIKPQLVIKTLSDLVNGEAIIVTDVGQHQMWAAQWFVCRKPRRFLSSGGLGTMGFGLPAAIGAKIGRPDLPVVLITGDGSFQMCLQELATIRQYNLPVKILLLNNNCLGMVRQWQQFFFEKRYSQTLFDYNPDFCQLARAYGLKAGRINRPQQIKGALDDFLAHPGPELLEVAIDVEENVLPMIPAGGGQLDFYPDKAGADETGDELCGK